MRVAQRSDPWKGPVALGLLVGLGGLVVVGPLGGVVGLLAGALAAHRTQAVLVAAAVALAAAAVFTLLEAPLSESGILTFPDDHPVAELFAKLAAVTLLAGLAGLLARLGRAATPRLPAQRLDDTSSRLPTSTIAAVLGAILVGAIALWGLGDRRWETAALAVAITALVLAAALAAARIRAGAPR